MATNEKGLNRGGIGGQEGEVGDESKDLGRQQTERSPVDRRSEERESPERRGQARETQGGNQPRGGLRREPDLEGAEKSTGHEVD